MKDNRHRRILSNLSKEEARSVSDLATLCGVSGMTLRRDLDELEGAGLVRRVWGGAVLSDRNDPGFLQRATKQVDAKRKLADLVANMLTPRQSLFIDAGSTAAGIAKAIATRAQTENLPLTITTCSIPVASHLVAARGIFLYQLGGEVDLVTQSVFGSPADMQIANMHFDVFVFSGSGLDAENGVTNASSSAVELKRFAMSRAKETWCVADSTKWGRTSFYRICSLDEVTRLFMDVRPSDLPPAIGGDRLIVCEG
ncbi:DeoR/GlpR family DNA-binding transcription regulator [Nitratireductor sp. StC3]|uniref:DeoR/GlpR family DNA-binding transcription regulator n=1 Tax=Nitratireductor sp. StC3 TaxID=2126741 RepID=UPI001304A30F|nr:DeoR/GlpR family DNA-binding transcription regulator [Nitratireductor sp. StC3]